MNKMNKRATFALAAVTALSLGACGAQGSAGSAASSAATSAEQAASVASEGGAASVAPDGGAASASDSSAAASSDQQAATSSSIEEKPAERGPNSSAAKLVDFGWVAFQMPEGFVEHSSDASATVIRQEGSADVEVTFTNVTTASSPNAHAAADAFAQQAPDANTKGEPFEAGGRSWYPVSFEQNGKQGVCLFTDISADHVCQVSASGLTEADQAVQTIVGTVVFDEGMIA